jgi:4-carboxymuconolactone decarboxylase
MARLQPLDPATLSPEQKAVHDQIAAGPRGVVRGPLAIWLRRARLAETAQALGQYCRFDSTLSKRLSELAILVTARAWNAEFEWYAHKRHAREAGLAPSIIEAIRTGETPVFNDPEEAVVHDIAVALHTHRRLNDTLYARGIATLGEARLVDLIGLLGYYTLVSMTLNAFTVDLPPDGVPELD